MSSPLNRREFTRLSSAALGGLMAGAVMGCNSKRVGSGSAAGSGAKAADRDHDHDHDHTHDDKPAADKLVVDVTVAEVHVCRGLNACKGKGQGGDNACAGQGVCATAKAHSCHTHNECKGQGGCGAQPGLNSCKGKGECAVPLEAGAWKTARTHFEKAMTDAGKKFAAAPAAPMAK